MCANLMSLLQYLLGFMSSLSCRNVADLSMSAHRDDRLTTTTNPAYEMMKQRRRGEGEEGEGEGGGGVGGGGEGGEGEGEQESHNYDLIGLQTCRKII